MFRDKSKTKIHTMYLWVVFTILVTALPSLSAGEVIPQAGWVLLSVDSEETARENGAAVNAFDGDPLTIWHTDWSTALPSHPHQISIDMGAHYDLTGFRYLPRPTGGNGTIIDYQFAISSDGVNWVQTIASTFTNDATEKEALFPSITARYIKLIALSEGSLGPWTTAAEINALTPAKLDVTISLSWAPAVEKITSYNVYFGLIKYNTVTPDILLKARADLALPDGVHKVCFQVTSVRGTEESVRSNSICAGFILAPPQPVIVPLTPVTGIKVSIQ